MLKDWIAAIPLTLTLAFTACGSEQPPEKVANKAAGKMANMSDMDHSAHMTKPSKPKKSMEEMKAKFGADYQPGDIGHSFGQIVSIAPDGAYATIDHGEIHGIGMGPMTMGFDALESADLSAVKSGDKVEFVLKKGDDDAYRILSICTLTPGQKTCLQG